MFVVHWPSLTNVLFLTGGESLTSCQKTFVNWKTIASVKFPKRLGCLEERGEVPQWSGVEPKTDFSAFKRQMMLLVDMFVVN